MTTTTQQGASAELIRVLKDVTDVLDIFGDLGDGQMDPAVWRAAKAEEKIKAAREALAASPQVEVAPQAEQQVVCSPNCFWGDCPPCVAAGVQEKQAEQVAKAGPRTLMGEEQAEKWAWEQVKKDVGTKGWTAGDSCNYFGFFLWGWRYRKQYERQRATPERAAAPAELTVAARDVLAERRRQVEQEGWTPEHDDQYADGELSSAAICYANTTSAGGSSPNAWPWPESWWKPADERRNLVKAGALILADIERLDRATHQPSAQKGGEA